MKFEVIREHIGDRLYKPGDTRDAARADVAHLIGKVLAEPKPKAAKPSANKAAAPVSNKAGA
ncbi:hypothetical protein [Kaistia sp. MMO-174]|uniref:hypothetical protein n=1 Tax=Kaistia sp. MMO-174 TaxID=3081256 RepID=UPI0030188866